MQVAMSLIMWDFAGCETEVFIFLKKKQGKDTCLKWLA